METAKSNPVKVINRAYELIDTNGWVQGRMVGAPDGSVAQGLFDIEHAVENRCKVCLEAALIIAEAEATGVLPSDVMFAIFKALQENTATEFPAYKATFRFAKATMGKRARDLERLLELNDYPTTRQEHVLGWLRGAAEGLRRGN